MLTISVAEPRSILPPDNYRDYFGKKPKIEFSLFHPNVSHSTDISPNF